VVVALGTGTYWYSGAAPPPRPVTAVATRGDVDFKITELSELRALESVTVLAQKDGPISYLVPEGTLVKPGDVLVRFDPSQFEMTQLTSRAELMAAQAELRAAQKEREALQYKLDAETAYLQGNLRLAEAELAHERRKPLAEDLERVRLEVEKARLAYENAEKKANVLPDLVAKGFVARSTADDAELAVLSAKATLQAARVTLEKTQAGANREDLERAIIRVEQAKTALGHAARGIQPHLQASQATIEKYEANVKRAQNLVDKATREVAKTEITAPQAGLAVYAKASSGGSAERVHLGMMAFAGQPLLYLPDTSTMVADGEVNEVDIWKVNLGALADVTLEAYPGAMFRGRVVDIGRLARVKRSRPGADARVKVFDVTVKIDNPDRRVKPGSTATVDIYTDRMRDVVSVPMSAVVPRKDGHVVFVATDGKPAERKITVGPTNAERVVVKAGLQPGEHVLLAPGRAGAR
jgi:HlyD family secretion protein